MSRAAYISILILTVVAVNVAARVAGLQGVYLFVWIAVASPTLGFLFTSIKLKLDERGKS